MQLMSASAWSQILDANSVLSRQLIQRLQKGQKMHKHEHKHEHKHGHRQLKRMNVEQRTDPPRSVSMILKSFFSSLSEIFSTDIFAVRRIARLNSSKSSSPAISNRCKV